LIGSVDIFQLSPGFQQAVFNVHNVLMGVALVVIFGALVQKITDAQRERNVGEILPALIRVTLISIFLTKMGAVSDFLGDMVTDVEEASGVNGNPMQALVAAIKAKFGVDPTADFGPISPSGQAGPTQAGAPIAGTNLTHYAYPGDSTPDSGSSNGQGAFQFTAPHSLIAYTDPSTPASAGLSADMAAEYNVAPGQNFQVTGSNGVTYNLIYMDTGADWETGRVDIYDPNNVLGGSNNFRAPITSFIAGTMATLPVTASNTGGNPGLFNSLLHPIQTAQIAGLGLFTLVLSYVAAFVQWLVAVAQSILLYSEIALAPIFVGFLMVRGYEGIAKTFILSFVGISMWRLAFLVVGLITQMLLGLAANTANVPGAGYLWFICVSLWVIFGSFVGPWWISKLFVRGASGVADVMFGAGSTGGSERLNLVGVRWAQRWVQRRLAGARWLQVLLAAPVTLVEAAADFHERNDYASLELPTRN
jgi:hypothetical protein